MRMKRPLWPLLLHKGWANMQRFCEKEARKLNKLKYILFDVDDTVTNGGKLTMMSITPCA